MQLDTLANVLDGKDSAPAVIAVGWAKAISRKELREAIYELACTLQKSGIRKGDVVSIADANTVSCPPPWC